MSGLGDHNVLLMTWSPPFGRRHPGVSSLGTLVLVESCYEEKTEPKLPLAILEARLREA